MEHSFIHLHNHSEFSILDGAVRIADLVSAAYENNMPAVALTDHGNIFGAVTFLKEAKAKGIKPIIGCEAYVAPRSRFDKSGDSRDPHHFHLVLLVKNEVGYRNLCLLLSKAYLEGFYYRPRIDKELLAGHAEGLIGLSSCLKGEVSFYLDKETEEAAEQAALEYSTFFGPGNFYLELQDHGLPQQKAVNPKIIELARRLELPLVATNDIHYLRKEDAESHDVLLCIQTNKKVSEQDRIRFSTQEFYFKSGKEMAELFPEAPDAIENTIHIAAQCNFEFPSGRHFLPVFKPPDGISLEEYLARLAHEGFAARRPQLEAKQAKGELLHPLQDYEARLQRELKLVNQMGFEGYFLIVWDMIQNSRARGVPVGPGRGSAAGSFLAYCLGITDIDPLEYDLLFERFLNPERISLPDIDIDFCARRRQEVIEYVTNKYGQDNVSQIITFGTMAARAAIRDVGRVLEVPLPEVDRIAKMIPPTGPDSTIQGALDKIPQLRELGEKNAKIAQLLTIARKLEGQVRHPSIHAAGIVITPRPLIEFMPLYQSVKGEITSQFPMQDIEAIGLLKMDLLGLRNLTVIRDATELISGDLGEKIDMDTLPLDDPATLALFQAGNTDGVFQFESQGMKELLRSFKPESFRDLIAMNALYRPGALNSGMTAEFVKRKHHPELVAYDVPELEPVLKETRGTIVYQEQVMKIATELAGFSLAEADILRKAMGKKVASIMKAQKQHFLQGAKKRGISSAKANGIFEQIKHFAEYGFNKSHAAVYAYLAFQTAYLKAHYPAHFMAALLTSEAERGATPQVVRYINECQAMGIKVLPPDINASDLRFTVAGSEIRFGLAAVKNVGEGAVADIIRERKNRGQFAGPFDIVAGTDPRIVNKKVLESLIKAGALDSLGWRRSQCFHLIDSMIDYGHELQKMKVTPQSLLFGGGQLEPPEVPAEVREMREWDESLFLSYEKAALGFYITGHPLAQFEKRLRLLASHTLAQLEEDPEFSGEVRVAGIISSTKLLKTKKDERFVTFVLEDLTSRLEVVSFPESYKRFNEFIREGNMVWVRGKYATEGEAGRITLSEIMTLSDAFQKQAKRFIVRIFLPGLEESVLKELKGILEASPGECPVLFELETPQATRVIAQSVEVRAVSPTDELVRSIEQLLGAGTVSVRY